ncbi:hypothetical protein GF327_08560 [Candidatus Woesearchaeota archaeon]|nr:hypothetical protein [Candidatus Woesearchaeota archaeon]
MDVSIKNIPDKDWRAFKVEAAKHNLKTGEMFSKLVNEHKEKCEKGNWKKFLYSEKTLTEKDTKIIKESIKIFRRDTEFR